MGRSADLHRRAALLSHRAVMSIWAGWSTLWSQPSGATEGTRPPQQFPRETLGLPDAHVHQFTLSSHKRMCRVESLEPAFLVLTEDDKADMQKWMEAPLIDVAKGCRYLRPFQRRKVQQLLTSLEASVFKPSEAQDRQREMRQQVREWIQQFQERINQLQVRQAGNMLGVEALQQAQQSVASGSRNASPSFRSVGQEKCSWWDTCAGRAGLHVSPAVPRVRHCFR